MRSTARDLIEHIEQTITGCRADLEATVDRLDAAIALRDLFFENVDDSACPLDDAVAAMTATEVDRARFAALTERMSPTPNKEHPT